MAKESISGAQVSREAAQVAVRADVMEGRKCSALKKEEEVCDVG